MFVRWNNCYSCTYRSKFLVCLSISSGVGKSCLLLRFGDQTFTSSFITTIGIDFKVKDIDIDGKRIRLQLWDTAGQERFRTITNSYYRGAGGILLVYDVTDEQSFQNVRQWMRNIEQYAADNVNKILVGTKCDLANERLVEAARGQALADEYGIKFFETSSKSNINVAEAFISIAKDVKDRFLGRPAVSQSTTGSNVSNGVALDSSSTAISGRCC